MVNSNPKVSIVIPVYNVEKYLRSCLDSIINQQFKDYEIILVNDGSTDLSLSICEEYANKYENIILINKVNGGLSSSRNVGMNKATGKYISFIDPDDSIDSNYLIKLVNTIEKNNCDVVVSGYITKPNNIQIEPGYKLNKVLNGRDFILSSHNVHSKNDLCFVWRYIYNLDLIRKNNILFNEKIFIGEDVVFNLEVLVNSNRVMAISDKLYSYTVNNPDSLMRVKYKPNLEESLIYQYDKRLDISKRYGLLKDEKYYYDMSKYYVNSIYPLIINNLKQGDDINYKKSIKRIVNYPMISENVKNLGLFYNTGSLKEYVYYLAIKFKIYPILNYVYRN